MLEHTSSLGFVRRISIRDATPHAWRRHRTPIRIGPLLRLLDTFPRNPCPQEKAKYDYRAKGSGDVLDVMREATWEALGDLLQHLPSLKSFVYACSYQLPACILRVLESAKPSCGLHLETFACGRC